jgi:hypothetical protein
MPNIKLTYLYRNAANYKQYGSVVLTNSNNISTDLVADIINRNLIDGEYFDADAWGVPPLFFDNKNEDDHNWHEFETVEITKEPPYSNVAIENLLDKILLA